MGEVYIWTTKKRPPTNEKGGQTKGRKNYRHKIFVGLKKVVTGQSQIMKKSCFKSSTQNDEKDIFGHVAICCVFTQHFHQLAYFGGIVNIVTIYGFTFF